jgi:surface polysaccharide O-acyltransferase-like enzyme
MIVYHAISCAWAYELRDLWGITDPSLLPEGVHAFINSKGKLEVLNPCVVFPWLHFFMPWFFYKSGQFFRKRSVKELWKKDSHKLLRTVVIWSVVGYVFFLFFGLLNDTLTLRGCTYSVVRGLFLRGHIPINGPCWFLLTLFGVRFVANIALPERGDKYIVLKILSVVVVGYIISFLAYRFNHRLLPYWVANGAAGLSFFALGYTFRDVEDKWWLIVIGAIVYTVGCVYGFPIVEMWPNDLVRGSYLLWIPIAFLCILFFNVVCQKLYDYIRIKPVEWIGKNAMKIYVSHMLVVSTITDGLLLYFNIKPSSLWVFVMIVLAYSLMLLALYIVSCLTKDKFFNFHTCKK